MRKLFLSIVIVTVFNASIAQVANISEPSKWSSGYWKARWISAPDAPATQFGVYHFRKSFSLGVKPAHFVVHVSGDNHYRLFVNGVSVCNGPARSDLSNWNYETVDLAAYLKAGNNLVAATVWNFGENRPYAQVSFETGFLLQGEGDAEAILNTDKSWKAVRDSAYSPLPINMAELRSYVVVASGEKVDLLRYCWGFASADSSDGNWRNARELWYAAKTKSFGTDGNWQLVPRGIPLMEEKPQDFVLLRGTDGSGQPWKRNLPLRIPANTKMRLLLDQGTLTNAYPVLHMSGGRHADVRLRYAEALVDSNRVKGNRNDVKGKKMIGITDEYILDGGEGRVISPLHFRTFRYVQVDILTGDDPMVFDDISSVFTGYPFTERASFQSGQPQMQKVWETGWRTARLCAMDTYFDCPYYEQLQYVGDTRIQALISLYVSGDDRLMKKAIDDISHSFIPEGLTQSRYPSRDLQVIPTFSLWWVCMVHDYYMQRKDDEFIRSKLDGIERVLGWYQGKMAKNGMLGALSWWQFVDWSWPWVDSIRVGGVPPGASHGGSSIISLQYAYTLRRASQLMEHYGRKEMSAEFAKRAAAISQATYLQCWDKDKAMLADDPSKKSFSQHANIMAVLTDAVPAEAQRKLLDKIMSDTSITPATYYFTFYLFEALKKTNLGDAYFDLLKPWYQMLDVGLTTFAENPEPTRSDCHAWSASPVYEFLSLVCGVQPAAPGFSRINIQPYLGSLDTVKGTIPHPDGDITVSYKRNGSKLEAEIGLPPSLAGTITWKGVSRPLHGGKQLVVF